MAKELEVKKQNEVAVTTEQQEMLAAMDYGTVESKDLKIPKLLLMQAMSKFVNEDGIAKAGDLVNSVTGEILGTAREKELAPVSVIPIDMFKEWVIYENLGGGKMEYREKVPVTPMNTDWPWTYRDENGREFKRVKNMNFFVLLEKDLGNPLALPYFLTFRSTGYKEGENISSHFALCATAKQAGVFRVPMDRVFEISGKVTKNDKGTFFVPTAREVKATSDDGIKQAFSWFVRVKDAAKRGQSFTDKVDNSDEIVADSGEQREF